MHKNCGLILLFTACLAGCGPRSTLTTEKDPMMGEEHCIATIRGMELTGVDDSELVLKHQSASKPIKATLNLAHKGVRDYTVNANESLTMVVDEKIYPLEIINSTKDAVEDVQYANVNYAPTASIRLGFVKEVTRRRITFLLTKENIAHLLQAKTVKFQITVSPASAGSSSLYPIVVALKESNRQSIKEFSTQCYITK
ncbi:hypothetical protein [Candidatus Odyssella acanthamoebae]|uniref:Uncharacterized protein n=1 Tax=Candidatus Odyssella acanthamoebae TaxID=91604 RepID=A0A077B0P9_9PROT|nr:hypothetical protein [Candidatus Paracaedibacter acanthamoebae]AIK96495.1 hypothetical protein ID47_06675 [Candidatus Paracaedibacter acanthamoebae]